jgi:DNA-binding LytR/AlgR family response regulator
MNLPLPCVRSRGDKELVGVFIEDVVFFTTLKNDIQVHTPTETFLLRIQGALDAFEMMFSPYGFSKLDSGNLVNLNKIKFVDKDSNTACFDNNLQTTISRSNMHKVKHISKKPT